MKKRKSLIKILFFEKRLPWRFQWVKYIPLINPMYYLKIFLSLNYKEMFRKGHGSDVNNKIVEGWILQIYGKKFLRNILKVCNKINMNPFLVFGTLLGHYREKGFIKHDIDLDLGLLENDFSKIELLKKELRKRRFDNSFNEKGMIQFTHPKFSSLHVDFWLFYKKKDKMTYYKEYSYKGKYAVYSFAFPSKIFEKFKKVKFLDKVEVLIPSKTEEFLTISYGDWKTPKKEFDNISGHPNVVK
ncbi:LicD family protein [Candidatus Woesearchaeota archaeon]|nr:LicD family protein [Candidatus Woesearchaeota archaeon]